MGIVWCSRCWKIIMQQNVKRGSTSAREQQREKQLPDRQEKSGDHWINDGLGGRALIVPRLQSTRQGAVTVVHTAPSPTAKLTGTRSVGLLWPVGPTRPQPTTAGLTFNSTVNQTCPHAWHFRLRVTQSGWCPLVAVALISPLPHLGQSMTVIVGCTPPIAHNALRGMDGSGAIH